MVRSKTFIDRFIDGLIIACLSFITLLCLAPLVHTVAISFSDKSAAAAGMVTFYPVGFNLYSYKLLLDDRNFFAAFGVSVQRVLLGCFINYLITILMAYPLSKNNKLFPGRNAYMWFVIFTMLFSGGLVPWYMTINTLGLINSIWALVLPTAVPVFNVVLLMNFFRGIPKELDEAGIVDGAGPWYMLFKIYVPVSLPALATITLFTIVGHWNSFFDGLILMNKPEKYPLQTYIQQLVVALRDTSTMDPEQIKRLSQISNKTLNAAKILISMIPIVAIYPFLQRYFIHGIVLGAVKE